MQQLNEHSAILNLHLLPRAFPNLYDGKTLGTRLIKLSDYTTFKQPIRFVASQYNTALNSRYNIFKWYFIFRVYRILPQQSLNFLLVVVLVHDVHIQLNIWLSIQRMFREVIALKVWVYVQTLGPKMIGARDVRYNALAVLSLILAPHPHVPIREVVGSWPICF